MTLAAVPVATAACGGSQAAPPVGAPPASAHTSAERAATMNWLATTNQMWTKDDFAALDRVTTGEGRLIYRTEQDQAAGDPSPSGRTPFRLTGLSITVPCRSGAVTGGTGAVFVAYADTDVFTLGQSLRPEAMVFRQAGGTWKLAAVVNGSPGASGPRWPALCRAGADPAAAAVLAPGGLWGGPGPGAGPRRDRRDRDHPGGGALRGQLILRRPGLDQRPVRHGQQA